MGAGARVCCWFCDCDVELVDLTGAGLVGKGLVVGGKLSTDGALINIERSLSLVRNSGGSSKIVYSRSSRPRGQFTSSIKLINGESSAWSLVISI